MNFYPTNLDITALKAEYASICSQKLKFLINNGIFAHSGILNKYIFNDPFYLKLNKRLNEIIDILFNQTVALGTEQHCKEFNQFFMMLPSKM